jgi:hypothetical protein
MVASSDASGIGLMVRRSRLPMAVAEFVRQEAQWRTSWDRIASGRLNASAMGCLVGNREALSGPAA